MTDPTDFLTALYEVAPEASFVTISGHVLNGDGYAVDAHGKRVWSDQIAAVPVAEIADLVIEQRDRWLTVQPRISPRRGSEDNAAAVVALPSDFDFAGSSDGKDPERSFRDLNDVRQFLAERVPLQASALIDSGHGVHAYWFLSEPVEPKAGKELLVRFDAFLQAQAREAGRDIDAMKDLARVMRLPGSRNDKDKDAPRPVTVAELHPSRRYGLDDFDFLPEIPAVSINPDTSGVTSEQTQGWVEALPEGKLGRRKIEHYTAELRGANPGHPEQGRRPTTMRVLGWASRDALAGEVDFRQAVEHLRAVFIELMGDESAGGEFDEMVARVVAYRVAEPMPSAAEVGTLADVLADVARFLRRFVYFKRPEQAVTLALYVISTYLFDAFDVTPYVHVRSPVKRCGKSLLLDLLGLLVRKPIKGSSISPAALYRVVDARRPTLLLDEIDTVFPRANRRGQSDPDKAELRGLINAGYRRGSPVFRSNQAGHLLEFDAFCSKVLAGIGTLPDTIEDRSIPIVLQRKPPGEGVERFRYRRIEPAAQALAQRIELVTEGMIEVIRDAEPKLPAELNDREQDTWELMLAIADEAEGDWPVMARHAAVVLSDDAADETEAAGIKLLSDLRAVWEETEAVLPSVLLIERLVRVEEGPYGDWFGGRGIDARWLAETLRPFDVHPRTVKFHGSTPRGYRREHFEPVWSVYVQ